MSIVYSVRVCSTEEKRKIMFSCSLSGVKIILKNDTGFVVTGKTKTQTQTQPVQRYDYSPLEGLKNPHINISM